MAEITKKSSHESFRVSPRDIFMTV